LKPTAPGGAAKRTRSRPPPPAEASPFSVTCKNNSGRRRQPRPGGVLKAINPAYELTGLDCVPERLAALDKTGYQQALCGFSSNLPVGNNSFDVIGGGEFIEHVPPSQIDPTPAEFFRVLRLKGRLLLTAPQSPLP
jgi:SAM-dependent methyltransferase